MNDIYKNIEEYNLNKNRKILIILSNKNLNPIVTGLFIRGRELNISLFFYHTILFCCAKKY